MLSILASIGFLIAVISFIGGFRMVRKADHPGESLMHKVNGYVVITVYVLLAALAIIKGTEKAYIAAWVFGLSLHGFKVLLSRKGLAVRYGGYLGAMMLITWLVVIFTHLPI